MTTDETKAVRAVARLARVLECSLSGLSLQQYRVLAAVEDGGERATKLAAALALAKPSITAAVDGLVERGLLVREPVPNDRRSVRIALTSEGRQELAEAEMAMTARLAAVLADHDDGGQAAVAVLAGLASLPPAPASASHA